MDTKEWSMLRLNSANKSSAEDLDIQRLRYSQSQSECSSAQEPEEATSG